MLGEEHFESLKRLRVKAMADKLREIVSDASYDPLTFEEKVELMIDAEVEARDARKLARRIKEANFKLPTACVEDILYLKERALPKDRILRLATCEWIEEARTVIVLAKTGGGKSYLCQALGNAACRRHIRVRYTRLADMCADIGRARLAGEERAFELLDALKTVPLLILDDFLTTPVSPQAAIDLFEIIEARDGRCATMVASQLEPDEWYLRFESELVADSMLNRLVSGAVFIDIGGDVNMRKYLSERRRGA